MRDEPGRMRSYLECRRGILLPIALLLVLALAALASSVLVLSRTERLIERGGLIYLQSRVRSESVLGMPAPSPGAAALTPLTGGFVLVRAAHEGDPSAPLGVHWRLDPDSVAASFPGAVEVGRDPPVEGVEGLASGCPSGAARPLVRVRGNEAVPAPDPPLSRPPRIGLLGIDRLLELPAADLPVGALPAGTGAGLLRAPTGARITGGNGQGVLLSSGDLSLEADTRFRGVVVVGGDLRMSGSARIEGVVLAGGTVVIADEARILGCPALATEVLGHPVLARAHSVRGGLLLGRF